MAFQFPKNDHVDKGYLISTVTVGANQMMAAVDLQVSKESKPGSKLESSQASAAQRIITSTRDEVLAQIAEVKESFLNGDQVQRICAIIDRAAADIRKVLLSAKRKQKKTNPPAISVLQQLRADFLNNYKNQPQITIEE